MTLPRWASLLDALPVEGTFEVVLHPGAEDPEAATRYPWNYEWEAEAQALESGELATLLARRGIETVPFSQLSES